MSACRQRRSRRPRPTARVAAPRDGASRQPTARVRSASEDRAQAERFGSPQSADLTPEQLRSCLRAAPLLGQLELRERYIGAYADEEARSGVLPNVYTDGSLVSYKRTPNEERFGVLTPATTRSSSGPPSAARRQIPQRSRPAIPRRPRPRIRLHGCGKVPARATATPLEASSTVGGGSCSVAAGSRSFAPSRIGYSAPERAGAE